VDRPLEGVEIARPAVGQRHDDGVGRFGVRVDRLDQRLPAGAIDAEPFFHGFVVGQPRRFERHGLPLLIAGFAAPVVSAAGVIVMDPPLAQAPLSLLHAIEQSAHQQEGFGLVSSDGK